MTRAHGRFRHGGGARAVAWQVALVAAMAAGAAVVALQTSANLERRGIASGFAYLTREAGFEIAASPVRYSSDDSYARALLVGLVNTLRVAGLGIVLASALGLAVGLSRLSTTWIVSMLARAYVEVMRNTPLLLQLVFWYALSQWLPEPRSALEPVRGVFVCFRGLFLPWPAWRDGALALEHPALVGFGFEGGASISPEFGALLVGLSTSTAAFIGEIVRGGILAVGTGQLEAAVALGFPRGRALRRVVLPQALPVVVPPITSQYINVTKNSSLAVAIGYPDLVSITSTTLNQTGQAIEAIALTMAVYVAISLLLSLAMTLHSRASARRTGGAGRE